MKEQKLKTKTMRDKEIEAKRQILDLEEEIHKQGERKKAIEYAKQYHFYQTERVKNFHSGLLLSRVMKERDAQIEFCKSKIKPDTKWEEQLKLNIEKAFKKEQEKAEKQHRERMALAEEHLKQKGETIGKRAAGVAVEQLPAVDWLTGSAGFPQAGGHAGLRPGGPSEMSEGFAHKPREPVFGGSVRRIKEHEEEKERRKKHEEKDAEEIKRQNLLYEIEMRKKLKKKKEKIDESRKLFFEYMSDKNIIKAVKQQQQEEEDEKIQIFIKAKKHLAQIRREKEAETHRLMEERREKINNFLSELIKEKLDNEDLIIAKDIAEAEAEWEKKEKEKCEKNKADLKAIAEHRAIMMKNKEEEERQRKIESKQQLLAIMKADQIFREQEKEKKHKADIERREVQDAHIQQMAKNKFNAQQAKEAELEYCRRTETLAAEKEKEFQDYAREVIELESESTSKYIYPLVKAVQEGPGGGRGPAFVDRGGLRPSYQANDFTGVQLPFYSSQESKYNLQKSKGRLGFTW
ncbi:coiled-coil domain-containing protein 173 isoform X3 [Heterocephalus glaber]|nr:coiled-coil domain-containing protein 173 isoform X3 [Heterocephalus glaber]